MTKGLIMAFAIGALLFWYFQVPITAVFSPLLAIWNYLLDALGGRLT